METGQTINPGQPINLEALIEAKAHEYLGKAYLANMQNLTKSMYPSFKPAEYPLSEMKDPSQSAREKETGAAYKAKAKFVDPTYNFLSWTGARMKPSSISFNTLRLMSYKCVPVRAVINLRRKQVPQIDWDIRLIDSKKRPNPMQQEKIDYLKNIFQRPVDNPRRRMTWSSFIEALIEDRMSIDAMCFEKVPNRRGMIKELHPIDGSCYSEDTEILTKQGWKKFYELTNEDVVATRSKTGYFEWQKPVYYHKAHYDGEMHHFEARGLDLLVTENHRVLLKWAGENNKKWKEKGWINHELIKKAKDIKGVKGGPAIPVTSKWIGNDIQGEIQIGQHKVKIEDWVAFIGIYIAEGCCNGVMTGVKTRGRNDVFISQSKKSKYWKEIEDLLNRTQWKFKYGGNSWRVADEDLYNAVRPLGNKYQKHIPEWIKELSPRLLNILWEWMVKGDGTKDYSKSGRERKRYYTVSKKLVSDCQEILQKIGKYGSVDERKPKIGHIKGREVRPTTEQYKISEKHSQGQMAQKHIEHYQGMVYCVSVPNEILYVQRNGNPVWCGNTIRPNLNEYNELDETEAYIQEINGIKSAAFLMDEIAYCPSNVRTDIYSYGYGYCLTADTRIITNKGYIKIKELVNQESIKTWNGKEWADSIIYTTGNKRKISMQLKDNSIIETSPDHQFKTIDNEGNTVWKKQSDLKANDWLICNTKEFEFKPEPIEFQYKPSKPERSKEWSIKNIQSDLWEYIGWLIGDGCFQEKTKRGLEEYIIGTCYDKKSEREIAQRHYEILLKYGIANKTRIYEYPNSSVIEIKFAHKGFGRFLKIIGCKTTKNNKQIPERIFHETIENRIAFIKGIFSADGSCKNKNNTPVLGISSKQILQEMQLLLQTLGIRSRWIWKKTNRNIGWGEKEYNDGDLYIYDKKEYFDKIGFIQNDKAFTKPNNLQGTRQNNIAPAMAIKIAKLIKQHNPYHYKDKDRRRIDGIIAGKWNVTKTWLIKKMKEYNMPEIEDLLYDQKQIESITDTGINELMYDLSIINSDLHQFNANGIIVHNCELESLIEMVTAILFVDKYNRSYFSNNSIPQGVMSLVGEIDPQDLEMWKRMWIAEVKGVDNFWKMPIVNVPDKSFLNWTAFKDSNREMQYNIYYDWLVRLVCAVYQTDPAEINVHGQPGVGGLGGQGGSTTVAKVEYSKSKGLRSLLNFIKEVFNNEVIRPVSKELMFYWSGVEAESRPEKIDLRTKEINSGFRTINEFREEEHLPPVEWGDIPANPTLANVYMQQQMAKQQGGGMGGPQPGQEEEQEQVEEQGAEPTNEGAVPPERQETEGTQEPLPYIEQTEDADAGGSIDKTSKTAIGPNMKRKFGTGKGMEKAVEDDDSILIEVEI